MARPEFHPVQFKQSDRTGQRLNLSKCNITLQSVGCAENSSDRGPPLPAAASSKSARKNEGRSPCFEQRNDMSCTNTDPSHKISRKSRQHHVGFRFVQDIYNSSQSVAFEQFVESRW